MLEYSIKIDNARFWIHVFTLVFVLIQNFDQLPSSHYFHQYPHGLHNKTVDVQIVDVLKSNITVLPSTFSKYPDNSNMTPPSKISSVLTSNNTSTTVLGVVNLATASNSENCNSTWQCRWGRQCKDSKCVWGCNNDLECEPEKVCELYIGRCVENPLKGLVWKNGYLEEKAALENKAEHFNSSQRILYLHTVLGIIASSWQFGNAL